MMKQDEQPAISKQPLAFPLSGLLLLTALSILIIGLGIDPEWLIHMVKNLH
jgi:hypothetical protein